MFEIVAARTCSAYGLVRCAIVAVIHGASFYLVVDCVESIVVRHCGYAIAKILIVSKIIAASVIARCALVVSCRTG